MKLRRRLMFYAAAAVLAATAGTLALPSSASAHGAMMVPGSRTYFCWKDGLNSTGAIVPRNAACAAAVARSGVSALYNWFAVLRSDGAGRMAGFIPDGELCSGGTGGPYNFTGFNLARADFPVTHLTAGRSMRFDYNNWAKHPGTFSLYVTKDSWSPTRALAWNDLEATPFSRVVNPESVGGPGTNDGRYSWTANLPSGKSGRHLIYSVWSRSDSTETFYGCSDVVFDGGNGEVTGIGDGTIPPPSNPPPSNPPPSNPPPSNPPPSSPPPAGGACTATYTTTNSWGGGFQGAVTVRATAGAVNNWMAHFNFPGSQTITQSWNGKHSAMGNAVMLQPESWNTQIPAGGSTTVGFLGSGAAPTGVSGLECMLA
jgi:predicted carbohydrate-binding protein with CBM5 and CBM33 domain